MKKIKFIAISGFMMLLFGCHDRFYGSECEAKLKKLYPDARFIDWEYDDGFLTAEFRSNGLKVDMKFGDNCQWLTKKTKYRKLTQLPDNIQQAFILTPYANWRIDDIEFIEFYLSPEKDYYKFDVTQKGADIDIFIARDGSTILPHRLGI